MNFRDSCTVVIRIKLTAPLLCPGSNAHVSWQHPHQVLPWLLSRDPQGHPCCSGCHGFRNKPPSDAVPPSPREDRLLMKAVSQKPCGVNVLPRLHDAAVLTRGQSWCLSWLCPSLHCPVSGGGPSQLCVCSAPSLPGVHQPLWHAVPRSSLSKEWVFLHFVFTLCFHT